MNRDSEPTIDGSSSNVRNLAQSATYPIYSFDEFVAALGSDTVITIRGEPVLVSDSRDRIPSYYFPFGSDVDLITKLEDLAVKAGIGEQALHEEWRERQGRGAPAAPADCWS